MGVVVVERVREHPVDERRLRGGHPLGTTDEAGLLVAALVEHVLDDRGAGVQPVGRDAQAEDVQRPLLDAGGDVIRHAVRGGVDREVGDPLAKGLARGLSHG